MGLEIALEVGDTGVDATYWRIRQFIYDDTLDVFRIVVHGYKDQASRDAGKASLTSKTFEIPIGGPEDFIKNPSKNGFLSDAYAAVKNPDSNVKPFANARDVLESGDTGKV